MAVRDYRADLRRASIWGMLLLVSVICSVAVQAQQVDILLKGGHVIDPRNGIDSQMDVAIADDRILQVAPNISTEGARRVVDVSGLFVTPGIVDLHGHLMPTADPVDGFTFRSGVTTIVDAGTFGWRNFQQALDQIENTRTRVFVILAIAGNKGASEGGHGNILVQDYTDYDPVMTAAKIRQHRDRIVGVKVWKAPDFTGIERAVEAGRLADVPVMIDFGEHVPPLSLERLLLRTFRPGDMYTHMYSYSPANNRETILGEDGRIKPYVLEARARGVIFDVGHGGGAFSWSQAIPAMKEGFMPDVISTDLHKNSMNDGMKDMANVMSKFLNLGMPLQQVIEAATWKPAQVIKREQVGHLTIGSDADIAVFNLREGDFGFLDVRDRVMKGNQKLEAELTILGGDVVWDLNGIAGTAWDTLPLR